MLIHIDSSAVADALGTGESAARSYDTLELLLQMHEEGQHVVSLSPEDIRRLHPVRQRWSRRAGRAFDHIHQRAPEILGLRGTLSWHLEVGLGDKFDGEAHPWHQHGQVIRAPLRHFDRTLRTIRAVLMGENITDIDFYIALARVLLAIRHKRSITIELERLPGGGSTLAPFFEQVADEGRILLAIADSDTMHPDGPPGDTWKKLQKKLTRDGQARPRFQRAREIHGREAENLVPDNAYDALFRQRSANDPGLPLVKDLRRLTSEQRAHADLKEGIKLYQIEREMAQGASDFWGEASRKLGRDRCQRPEDKCQERKKCACYVVKGFGSQVLEQIVEWLKREGIRHPREIGDLFGLLDNERLIELCNEVIAWGCALPRRTT